MIGAGLGPALMSGARGPVPAAVANLIGATALPSWLTMTRASGATYFNSAGLLQTVGNDVPRFDHTIAGVALGLRREGSRINAARWCRDLTNAVWVKSNATAAKDQAGIDGVANSASSLTATAGNGTCLQTVTATSNQRTLSAYVKRLVGSGAVEMTIDNGVTWVAITIGATWARAAIPAQTVTNPVFGFRLATNGDAIAVDYVQNEIGADASSPIATTSASVTRSAETFTLGGSALTALQGAAWSMFAETYLDNTTTGSRQILTANGTYPPLLVQAAGPAIASMNASAGVTITNGNAPINAPFRAAIAGDATGRSLSAMGAASVSDANAFSAVTSATMISQGNIYLRKAAFYARRLAESELRNLTA